MQTETHFIIMCKTPVSKHVLVFPFKTLAATPISPQSEK